MNLSNRNSSVLRERMSQPVLYSTHPTESASLHILLQSTMYCKYSLKLKGYAKIGCATPDMKNH